MSGILILGAGGHGKVAADILQASGAEILGFLDDGFSGAGQEHFNLPVVGKIDDYHRFNPTGLIWGIGNNKLRQNIQQRLGVDVNNLWVNAIHPNAVVASSVELGRGIVFCANAVVNPDCIIGCHSIINTAATIDHDCRIGSFVHVAPGSHLAGGVAVGEGAFLGVGACVVPGVQIGQWATVGAGSVVLKDIDSDCTAYGAPARIREK